MSENFSKIQAILKHAQNLKSPRDKIYALGQAKILIDVQLMELRRQDKQNGR